MMNVANYILGIAIAINNRTCNKAFANDILAMLAPDYAHAFTGYFRQETDIVVSVRGSVPEAIAMPLGLSPFSPQTSLLQNSAIAYLVYYNQNNQQY